MKDFRCTNCNKLLAFARMHEELEPDEHVCSINVKCHRCKEINTIEIKGESHDDHETTDNG